MQRCRLFCQLRCSVVQAWHLLAIFKDVPSKTIPGGYCTRERVIRTIALEEMDTTTFFGYGASDELHSGLSADTLRGAEGGDGLFDGQGAGDLDQVCLGDGPDVASVVDNDGKDWIYDTPSPDGWDEDVDANWAMGDQMVSVGPAALSQILGS